MLAEAGHGASWIVMFFAAVVAVFVLYLGIAIWATLRAPDPGQQEIRYRVFRDLLELFLRRRRS
jgi:hypothetical protein